jgi:tRNA threonylcarbamoyl adenosine modification protein YeaZ
VLILAMDTATEAVGAAVLDTASGSVVGRATVMGPMAHGEQLAPVVADALAQGGLLPADLGAIGVGRGPGPYTGLRVGLVHAEVLGWTLGIPVHGVCTLDVVAAEAAPTVPGEFLVVTDARRREVYWAAYGAGGVRIGDPQVGSALDVPGRDRPAVGAGATRYPDAFADRRPPEFPDPGVLARLVAARISGAETIDVSPLYLRRPDAVVGAARKRVTPT